MLHIISLVFLRFQSHNCMLHEGDTIW